LNATTVIPLANFVVKDCPKNDWWPWLSCALHDVSGQCVPRLMKGRETFFSNCSDLNCSYVFGTYATCANSCTLSNCF